MKLEDLKLSHYSDVHIKHVSKIKPDLFGGNTYKPRGFWVSVDGPRDWKEWCEAENFALPRLKYRHRVELSTIANVLHIKHDYQFVMFTSIYKNEKGKYGEIDWSRVTQRYDGIIIAPYNYSRRLSASWYYGWDCASGCIWNMKAIKSLTLLQETGNEH